MRPHQITIDQANLGHVSEIEALYVLLFNQMSDLQPEYYQKAKQDIEFIQQMIKGEASAVFVALEEEVLAGFIIVQEQVTPPYNCLVQHRFAFVVDLITAPAYRQRGIGTLLINQVEKWAKERSLNHVELCVLAENEKALHLYQKLNFKPCMHTLKAKL